MFSHWKNKILQVLCNLSLKKSKQGVQAVPISFFHLCLCRGIWAVDSCCIQQWLTLRFSPQVSHRFRLGVQTTPQCYTHFSLLTRITEYCDTHWILYAAHSMVHPSQKLKSSVPINYATNICQPYSLITWLEAPQFELSFQSLQLEGGFNWSPKSKLRGNPNINHYNQHLSPPQKMKQLK